VQLHAAADVDVDAGREREIAPGSVATARAIPRLAQRRIGTPPGTG